MSHGSQAEHQAAFSRLREVTSGTGRNIGVLADLQGPKIRLGRSPGGPVVARPRATIQHHHRGRAGRPARCRRPLTRAWPATCNAGDRDPHRRRPGRARGRRGRRHRRPDRRSSSAARFPTTRASTCPASPSALPALSEKDMADLRWALRAGRATWSRSPSSAAPRTSTTSRRSWTRRASASRSSPRSRSREAVEHLDEIVAAFDGDHGGPRRPRRRDAARAGAGGAEARHRSSPAARPSRSSSPPRCSSR